MSEPARLVTTKPDAELAAEFKRDMMAAFEPVVKLLESAKAQGFVISFQIGPGPLGNLTVTQLQVMKQF